MHYHWIAAVFLVWCFGEKNRIQNMVITLKEISPKHEEKDTK